MIIIIIILSNVSVEKSRPACTVCAVGISNARSRVDWTAAIIAPSSSQIENRSQITKKKIYLTDFLNVFFTNGIITAACDFY